MVEIPDPWRQPVYCMAADAASLLVAGQIIPVDDAAHGGHGVDQLPGGLGVEKFGQLDELTLIRKLPPQPLQIESAQLLGNAYRATRGVGSETDRDFRTTRR